MDDRRDCAPAVKLDRQLSLQVRGLQAFGHLIQIFGQSSCER